MAYIAMNRAYAIMPCMSTDITAIHDFSVPRMLMHEFVRPALQGPGRPGCMQDGPSREP